MTIREAIAALVNERRDLTEEKAAAGEDPLRNFLEG